MSFNKKTVIPGFYKLSLLLVILLSGFSLSAQESADKIITIIGRDIILQSELEMQFNQIKAQNPAIDDSMKCQILQGMIMQKILKAQAERDSVLVSDDDVEGQLDNRLRYFIQLYGSKEKLEQVSGKTIYQIKEENREAIRDQMVAEKLQNQVLENVKITPAEVEAFYKKIPVDSLPFFPATVEVGQIVIDPPVSQEMYDYAKGKLEEYRKEIVDGKVTFEMSASFHSDDPGSRDNGGRYDGVTRNGPWAAEFVAAAFKLQNGEISPVFKTKFGYHIIQMIQRRGDEADLRHILVKPEITSFDIKKSLEKLDSVRNLLVTGKMLFPEAVGKFSTDEAAKRTGGMVGDPQTGNTDLDIAKLDPGMVLLLDTLKEGGYSAPHIYMNEMRDKSCRIIYLKSKTTPHKANLKDDYNRIHEVALAQKKAQKMQTWVNAKLPTYYMKISPEYQNCGTLKMWQASTDTKVVAENNR
jgi:peptidyl-prolyl cis-trans isomerase SurA